MLRSCPRRRVGLHTIPEVNDDGEISDDETDKSQLGGGESFHSF